MPRLDLPLTVLNSGLIAQLLAQGEGGRLNRIIASAHSRIGPSHSPEARVLHIRSGRFQLWIDRQMVELGPQEMAQIPAHSVWSYLCLEGGMMLEQIQPAELISN